MVAGVPEISILYQVLLVIEYSNDSDLIRLDMHQLDDYFESEPDEDDYDIETETRTQSEHTLPYLQLGKEYFNDRYSILRYIYLRLVVDTDDVKLNLEYIKKLNEDDFIAKVLWDLCLGKWGIATLSLIYIMDLLKRG